MTNTLYADIDALQAEVKRLHKGWTEDIIMLINAETENADLKEANRRLKAEIVKFAKGIKAAVSKQVEKE